MIGTFGSLVFEVSTRTIRTFDNLEMTKTPDWAAAKVIAGKPRPQFNGPGQDTVKFSMKFDDRTTDPEEELSKLTRAVEKGTVSLLILDSKPYGSRNARWYISGMSIQEIVRDNKGRLQLVECELTLSEYH